MNFHLKPSLKLSLSGKIKSPIVSKLYSLIDNSLPFDDSLFQHSWKLCRACACSRQWAVVRDVLIDVVHAVVLLIFVIRHITYSSSLLQSHTRGSTDQFTTKDSTNIQLEQQHLIERVSLS